MAMASLYKIIPAVPHAVSGVIVALVFRLVQIALAALGLCYYWSADADWERIEREARELAEACGDEDEAVAVAVTDEVR